MWIYRPTTAKPGQLCATVAVDNSAHSREEDPQKPCGVSYEGHYSDTEAAVEDSGCGDTGYEQLCQVSYEELLLWRKAPTGPTKTHRSHTGSLTQQRYRVSCGGQWLWRYRLRTAMPGQLCATVAVDNSALSTDEDPQKPCRVSYEGHNSDTESAVEDSGCGDTGYEQLCQLRYYY